VQAAARSLGDGSGNAIGLAVRAVERGG
jgi:hypothetical protein